MLQLRKLWAFISNIGIHPNLTQEKVIRVKLTNRICFISFSAYLVYQIIDLFLGIHAFTWEVIMVELVLLFVLFLLYRRVYNIAKFILFFVIVISVSSFTVAMGTKATDYLMLIPLSVMPLLVFNNKKLAILFLLFIYLDIFAVWKIAQVVDPVMSFPSNLYTFFNKVNVIVATLITFCVVYVFRIINEGYEKDIINQKKIIESKNKEIIDSITYAKRIQEAILPPNKKVAEQLPNSFILYEPKDIVAGDFYWMANKKGKILFAACDCTGHGVPGAMVSVVCANALNRSVNEFGLTVPAEILNKTRELIIAHFEQSQEDVKDGMDIALCSLEGNMLEYAGAYNPLWIIKEGSKEVLQITADKQPIGKHEGQKPFANHKIDLQKADTIYIFSDGYADQFGGAKGKKFKYKPLKKLLLSVQSKDMPEQKEILNKTFKQWKGSLEQVDDVCIIGVRI